MPYDIKKVGDQWKTVNANTGKVYGTHVSQKEARAQQKALYANTKDEKVDDMGGVYTVSLEEDVDLDEASYDASAPDSAFAYVPSGKPPSARKFKIGDAGHVKIAVSAFANWSFRGNAPSIP